MQLVQSSCNFISSFKSFLNNKGNLVFTLRIGVGSWLHMCAGYAMAYTRIICLLFLTLSVIVTIIMTTGIIYNLWKLQECNEHVST